jgi:tetratricopeptide (TPR) repeat protein
MTGIVLPLVLAPLLARGPVVKLLLPVFAVTWLGFAIGNIRVTVPLWNDEVTLWRWALQQDPGSLSPQDHLLSAYMARNDHQRARELADALVAENAPCPVCMLNAANLAIAENDVPRASLALSKLKDSRALGYNKDLLQGYILATGGVLELQGNLTEAEEAYRGAIGMDPLDPVPQITLAMLLAREGHTLEARKAADIALAMFAPDERERRRTAFEQALASASTAP